MLSLRLPTIQRQPEVCPPSQFLQGESLLRRVWRRWAVRRDDPEVLAQRRLQAVRAEFAQALADIPSQHAQFLAHQLRHCRSMRDLWHLRSELFYVIAREHSEGEAEARIAPLNRHFPTRSPRSGFAPLAD
jgi:hypothetical protein